MYKFQRIIKIKIKNRKGDRNDRKKEKNFNWR